MGVCNQVGVVWEVFEFVRFHSAGAGWNSETNLHCLQ